MQLVCKHCGYEWDYQGNGRYWATCPRCLYKVRVPIITKRGVHSPPPLLRGDRHER